MKRAARTGVLLLIAFAAPPTSAANISLEIAAERVQITARHEWLQLLAELGVDGVRVRGARGGESPSLETTADGHHRLVGLLTARGELHLPGGRFTRGDAARLRDYFANLTSDGAAGVLESKGSYGLTRRQFEQLFETLKRRIVVPTRGETLESFVDKLAGRAAIPIDVDHAARARLRAGTTINDDLRTLSIGTGLAIALRGEGLALAPAKPRGQGVRLVVTPIAPGQEGWPIGYPVTGPPRAAAPDLMQSINVEIAGFTLQEAVDAITPRLELPVVWDAWSLAERGVDPTSIEVELARSKRSYKRILEKLLFQARLRGQLRTDEAGAPFYWISAER